MVSRNESDPESADGGESTARLDGEDRDLTAGTTRPPVLGATADVKPGSLPDLACRAELSWSCEASIGRGGLGEVYRARDASLHREVAIKLLHEGASNDDERRRRFEWEAAVTGTLNHPSVVPVYAPCLSRDGRRGFVMRLIEGEDLLTAVRRFHAPESSARSTADAEDAGHSYSLRDLLRHFVAACETVAFAHERGIAHCDLKPQNIRIGKRGETFVVDWGEAIQLDLAARRNLTRTGALPSEKSLTPSGSGRTLLYCPPEDLDTSFGKLIGTPTSDERPHSSTLGDVYSLGVTLYNILTGFDPFRPAALSGAKEAASAEKWIRIAGRIRKGEFPSPRQLDRGVDRDLDGICRKAMALHPLDRYAGPGALAADVRRWLDFEPVEAVPPGVLGRGVRWLRKYPRRALVGATLVLLVTGVSAFAVRGIERQNLLRDHNLSLEREKAWLEAKALAESVSREIEWHWAMLSAEASRSELIRLIASADPNLTDDHGELGEYLQTALDRYPALEDGDPDRRSALNLFHARTGVRLARAPAPESTAEAGSGPTRFHYRSYFHGGDCDECPGSGPDSAATGAEPGARPKVIRGPHVSAALQSTLDQELKVAFSVPVRDSSGQEILAVLAVTKPLQTFTSLREFREGRAASADRSSESLLDATSGARGNRSELSASLIDVRCGFCPGNAELERGSSTFLHHPELRDLLDPNRRDRRLPEIATELAESLRRELHDANAAALDFPGRVVEEYADPFDPGGGERPRLPATGVDAGSLSRREEVRRLVRDRARRALSARSS